MAWTNNTDNIKHKRVKWNEKIFAVYHFIHNTQYSRFFQNHESQQKQNTPLPGRKFSQHFYILLIFFWILNDFFFSFVHCARNAAWCDTRSQSQTWFEWVSRCQNHNQNHTNFINWDTFTRQKFFITFLPFFNHFWNFEQKKFIYPLCKKCRMLRRAFRISNVVWMS